MKRNTGMKWIKLRSSKAKAMQIIENIGNYSNDWIYES